MNEDHSAGPAVQPTRGRSTVVLALAVPLVAGIAVASTFLLTDSSSGTRAGAADGAAAIDIKNFQFNPTPLVAGTAMTITITNSDDTAHTVTSDKTGAFDTGPIQGGGTTTITVKSPGTYAFHCDIHNYMQGVIRVSG